MEASPPMIPDFGAGQGLRLPSVPMFSLPTAFSKARSIASRSDRTLLPLAVLIRPSIWTFSWIGVSPFQMSQAISIRMAPAAIPTTTEFGLKTSALTTASAWATPERLLLGDANQSGVVDLHDFILINQAALNPPPPGAGEGVGVPEPTSLALLSLGVVIASLRRTRNKKWYGSSRWPTVVLMAVAAALIQCEPTGTSGCRGDRRLLV